MPIRIGVIGVGYLGQHHARILAEIEGAELVAVADTDNRRSEETAGTYGCRSFSGYADMIGICDALCIVTPTTTHHSIAMECLRAGKDILIEKPITENLEEAGEIVAEAEKNGLVLQVGHLERYNQGIIAAAEMIREPKFLESERLSPFLGRGTDVDVTLDLMIHDIDIILSIVKSGIKDIKAVGETVLSEKIDAAKVWIEFENGCNALMTASRLSSRKQRTLKVFQKDARIVVDYQRQEVSRHYKNGAKISSDVIKPETKEPLKEELKDFIYCVKDRKKPRVSGVEAVDALDVVLRITKILHS